MYNVYFENARVEVEGVCFGFGGYYNSNSRYVTVARFVIVSCFLLYIVRIILFPHPPSALKLLRYS